jgi:hypothetical protein
MVYLTITYSSILSHLRKTSSILKFIEFNYIELLLIELLWPSICIHTVCMCKCMLALACANSTNTRTHTQSYIIITHTIHRRIHPHTCIYTYIHTHIYIYTCTYTCIHTYVYYMLVGENVAEDSRESQFILFWGNPQ